MGTMVFDELKALVRYTRRPEKVEEGRDRLIRFLDSFDRGTDSEVAIVDSLCAYFGLFPYVRQGSKFLSTNEAMAYEFHRPDVELSNESFVFHEDQAKVYFRLLDGESVILSAPTSFGKSAILDALVASRRWDNFVVIVPTVALIDEVRRRLTAFSKSYRLVTHPTQPSGERNIYILTQERFLDLPSVPQVDFFMIDEFYKLCSTGADDQRMSLLNIAWKQLRSTGAQYYLAGPNVDRLAHSLDEGLRQSLVVSRFQTVAVDVEYRGNVADGQILDDMCQLWPGLQGTTLVFVSSPSRAERVAVQVAGFPAVLEPTCFARRVAEWLSANYHPEWRVVQALRSGVAIHTGPMPRSLQRVMIRLFGQDSVSVLVCTSTLIEGVNTSAKNVIVYDKKINNKPIDYFTFSNVRGRAGRMSRHFLGRVISYMDPPAEVLTEVDIPIDSQGDSAPVSAIVQLASEELTDSSRKRLEPIVEQSYLSLGTIRANKGFDPELQIKAAKLIYEDSTLRAKLARSGSLSIWEMRPVIDFCFHNILTPSQRRGMNVSRLVGMVDAVRQCRGCFVELISNQEQYKFPNEDVSDLVSRVLAFERNWMGFVIPSMLRCLQRIYNEIASKLGGLAANYELLIAQVESLFLPEGVLDLDEYGLPVPIAMRFYEMGMVQSSDVSLVLSSFVSLAKRFEVRSKLSDVELWIVDDVLEGLGEL
jgi:helicase conserved domain protein